MSPYLVPFVFGSPLLYSEVLMAMTAARSTLDVGGWSR